MNKKDKIIEVKKNNITRKFIEACENNDGEKVKKMARSVKNIDVRSFESGVKTFVLKGDKEVVDYLIDMTKDINNVSKINILNFLIEKKYNEQVKKILHEHMDMNEDNFTSIFMNAMKHKNVEIAERLIKKVDKKKQDEIINKALKGLSVISTLNDKKMMVLISRYSKPTTINNIVKLLMFNPYGTDIAREMINEKIKENGNIEIDISVMEQAVMMEDRDMIDLLIDRVDLEAAKKSLNINFYWKPNEGEKDGYNYFLSLCKRKEDKKFLEKEIKNKNKNNLMKSRKM